MNINPEPSSLPIVKLPSAKHHLEEPKASTDASLPRNVPILDADFDETAPGFIAEGTWYEP
jgi:hypothetical protein